MPEFSLGHPIPQFTHLGLSLPSLRCCLSYLGWATGLAFAIFAHFFRNWEENLLLLIFNVYPGSRSQTDRSAVWEADKVSENSRLGVVRATVGIDTALLLRSCKWGEHEPPHPEIRNT